MKSPSFFQVGYIVPDLEAAMRRWLDCAGIGPFFVLSASAENGRYRGRPQGLELRCAMAQAGPMQVELLQQTAPGPSAYRDMYDAAASGFHHLAYLAPSMDAEVAYYRERGVELAFIANFGPLNFAYFDTRAQLGYFTEVLEEEPGVMAMFDMIAKAANGWDGKEPIRYL